MRPETWPEALWGCVLIGGHSSRMGRPKHLILHESQTWLERIVTVLQKQSSQVILAGSGEVPLTLARLTRVADVAELAGPLAGILAVMRRFPKISWLVAACDQPLLSLEALEWLLAQRQPAVLAVLPDVQGDGRVEPLLAYYDWRCRPLLEAMAATGCLQINRLKELPGVSSPQPPENLRSAWRNINTPEELAAWLEPYHMPAPLSQVGASR